MGEHAERSRAERLPKLARFEVLRPLGGGAGGLVYEAVDRERGQRVAIKTLHAMDAGSLLQLKAEFRALQDIEHPNLLRLDELVRDGDTWFLTMELVEGTAFHSWVTGDDVRRASSSDHGGSDPLAAHGE